MHACPGYLLPVENRQLFTKLCFFTVVFENCSRMRPRGALTACPLVLMKVADGTSSASTTAWLNLSAFDTHDARVASRGYPSGIIKPGSSPWCLMRRMVVPSSPLNTRRRTVSRRITSNRRQRCHVTFSLAQNFEGETLRLGEEARLALENGDIYKVLRLLEESVGTRGEGKESDESSSCPRPHQGTSSAAAEQHHNNEAGSQPTSPIELSRDHEMDTPRAAHARLIEILWTGGHQQEAVETFDLVRERVKEAAFRPEQTSSAYRRSSSNTKVSEHLPRRKRGAGIPGLHLDLKPDTCHGIMRRKIEGQDWLGVIEVMRAVSSVSSRRVADGGRQEGENEGGSDRRRPEMFRGAWAPTEETYALGLEACARVSDAQDQHKTKSSINTRVGIVVGI